MKSPLLACLLLLVSLPSQAYLWSSAIPREIHLVPNGLVLVGDFDTSSVACASGPRAIFLPANDPMFKEKLTLALTAKASQKPIRAVLSDPAQISCTHVLAHGYVPVVSYYFWQLLD